VGCTSFSVDAKLNLKKDSTSLVGLFATKRKRHLVLQLLVPEAVYLDSVGLFIRLAATT
jgi:hypothetical protein